MSQITTHILDTAIGKPAANVSVALQKPAADNWQTIAQGVTNTDGRVPDLLGENVTLEPGNYRLVFFVGDYFNRQKVAAFYPQVEIIFTTTDREHYHVPLLLNPFGFSTYRGS